MNFATEGIRYLVSVQFIAEAEEGGKITELCDPYEGEIKLGKLGEVDMFLTISQDTQRGNEISAILIISEYHQVENKGK
jgi:hypothetical protein